MVRRAGLATKAAKGLVFGCDRDSGWASGGGRRRAVVREQRR